MKPKSVELPGPDQSGPASESGNAIRAALERQLEGIPAVERKCAIPAVPDHDLLHRIGIGSYGEVWLARNALGTLRAVKIVYRVRFEDERPYEREFSGILKYEPISRSHEGLMQVLHVGRNDKAGCFYYMMELADPANAENGLTSSESYQPRTLRSELARRKLLPPPDAAQLGLRLAGALAHLHSHGLVHRDVKPGNVIFVGGHPKLADIGLVASAGDSRSFVGTEGFIPPEGPGSPQADLYGLGKLLYELATGRDRMDFPQLPVEAARPSEGEGLLELNEVITRACAAQPAQRYATATEMQADLNFFLGGRSLRHARKIEQHVVWLKRLALAACALAVLAGIAFWFTKDKEQQARERARVESVLRQRAESAEQVARQQLYAALVEQARAMVRSGELGHRVRAMDALRRAGTIRNQPELRREAMTAMELPDLRLERELRMGPEATVAQLDPAFKRMAIARGTEPLEIWSIPEQKSLATLDARSNRPAFCGRWSPDGRFCALDRERESEVGDLEVWEVERSRCVLRISELAYGAFGFHPHLPVLIGSSRKAAVVIWELEGGKEIGHFDFASPPSAVGFSPDGERFVAAYVTKSGSVVSSHQTRDGKLLSSSVMTNFVFWLDWHPGGRWIAAADNSGSVRLIDSFTGDWRELGRHKAEAVLTAFSPDGGYLISAGWEREMICWDLRTRRPAFPIGLESFIAQFSADGAQCAIRTKDAVLLHAFERPTSHREFGEDLGGRLRRAAFSSDGRWLAVSGIERLGVWDLASEGPGAVTEAGAEAQVFFSPTGELFASRDDKCFAWRPIPGTNVTAAPVLQQLDLPGPRGLTSLCVASNRVVLTGLQGSRVVSVQELLAGQGQWSPTDQGLNGASTDGRWLAIYRPFMPILSVYRLPGLEAVATLTNRANIRNFEFSPRGDELAVASSGRIEFWSTVNWQRTRELTNFMGVLFTPDGQGLWLSRDYRTGGLYDANSLESLLPLPSGMLPLALSADGRHLAVTVDARRVQVWDLVQVRDCLKDLGVDWAPSKPERLAFEALNR